MKIQLQNKISIILFFALSVARVSTGIISTVNKELFESKELEYSIANPFFGHMFKAGALHNMRLFYHNIKPRYKNCTIRDQVHDTGKDTVAKLLIMLFPSPGGSLCTTTQWYKNFAKHCFSGDAKTLETNIKMLATTFVAIHNNNEVNYVSWLKRLSVIERSILSDEEKVVIERFMNSIMMSSSEDTELVLLTIHAFALEVLDTEEEYKLYLETILINMKGNDKIGKISIPTNTQEQKNRSDFIDLCMQHEVLDELYNDVSSCYPYSKQNMPASISSIPEYCRPKDTFLSNLTFSDCADITLLHLCNVLFYDEVLGEYNLDHLNLDDDSDLKKFYDKNRKPFEITCSIREEWSRVIQCLDDLVIEHKHNESIGIINYNVVRISRIDGARMRNSVSTGFVNAMTILTQICTSKSSDAILKKYKELFDIKDLDKRDVFVKVVELLNMMTAKHITVNINYRSKIAFETKNEYYGELYIDINYAKEYMETSTTMMFGMSTKHAFAEFISRETPEPSNILQRVCLDNPGTQLSCSECVLLAYARDIQGAEYSQRLENNRFDVLYNQGRLLTDEQKDIYLAFLYNNFCDLEKKALLNEALLSKVTEMIVKSEALSDSATEDMFKILFVSISSLRSRLGDLDSVMKLYIKINSYPNDTNYSENSHIYEIWDEMICEKISNLDKVVLNKLPCSKVVCLLKNTGKNAKFKSIEIFLSEFWDCKDLCKALQKHVYVEFLKLPVCILKDAQAKTIMESLLCNECRTETIREITADEINRIRSDHTNESLQSLLQTMCIKIPTSQIHKEQCDCLMKNASKLTSLDLHLKGDKCFCHLASVLINENCTLTSLDLHCEKMSLKEMIYLCCALNNPNCKLTSLRFKGWKVSSENLKYLSAILQSKNCKLKNLDISHQRDLMYEIKPLCDALVSDNCKLNHLDVSSNNLQDEGAKQIAEALQHKNCKLTYLDVSNNWFTSEGKEALVNALESDACKARNMKVVGLD